MKSHIKISQEYVSYFHAIHKTVSLEPYRKMKVPKKIAISVSYNRKDISAYLNQAGFQTDFDDISDFIYSFKDSAIILNKYNQVFHNRLSYIRKAYISGFNQPLPPDIQRITKKRYKNLTINDLVQLSNTIKGLTYYEIY